MYVIILECKKIKLTPGLKVYDLIKTDVSLIKWLPCSDGG